MLEKHEKSGNYDPKKKKKPTCLVRWCKEILPISNTSTCKTFQLKVCFKHRFLADHTCKKVAAATMVDGKGRWNDRFLAAMASRNGRDCGSKSGHGSASTTSSTSSSIKAY